MKILLSGSLSVDQIMNFEGLFENLIQPDKLHVLSISTLVQSLKRTPGGTAGNIAYSLALLEEKPILYGAIGHESKSYMNDLKKLGVDISHVHYSDLPTATFNVLTDKNDCQVGGFYPGAMADASSLSVKKFKDEDILFVVSPHDPKQMIIQANECIKYKKRMFFDVGQQILALSKEDLLTGLKACELLIVNDYEMGMLVKKTQLTKQAIIKQTKVCVITLGEKGSTIYSKKDKYKPYNISAAKVSKAIDPTGAGDAFRAGFIYGYIRDWELTKTVQLASVTAAYAVEKHGTQEHHFDWKLIKNRYQENYKETITK
ncbi:MAG: carbohydrate kinase family protein [Candidatus Pacebacteria bacterium]|nr:carbohydrate kinase family protein [Candidatus Paceibacterota bacterium]